MKDLPPPQDPSWHKKIKFFEKRTSAEGIGSFPRVSDAPTERQKKIMNRMRDFKNDPRD